MLMTYTSGFESASEAMFCSSPTTSTSAESGVPVSALVLSVPLHKFSADLAKEISAKPNLAYAVDTVWIPSSR